MKRILIYSGLLLAGMAMSQGVPLEAWRPWLHVVTMVCLSYIMVEVGLEFSADVKHLADYTTDFWIAAAAATFPWLFCVLYFNGVLGTPLKEAGLVGLFAAATSAGVLFTMLAAAGLRQTWVFQKARSLAIFDDLVTILWLIPLQIAFVGLRWQFAVTVVISLGLLAVAYRWLNRWAWPVKKSWLLLYGGVIAGLSQASEHWLSIQIGVLLPSFVLGCLLRHQATLEEGDDPHSRLDQGIKALFMFLVGCSLPRITMGSMNLGMILIHMMALTVLSNLGKCVPLLCYRKEASQRQRLALSIAMFPRGEVGAGVLLVALSYGITGASVVLGSLSLALNLLLTGIFIKLVVELTLNRQRAPG